MTKYIIYRTSVWFDEKDWLKCNSFLNFRSQVQAIEYCKQNNMSFEIWG